MHVLSVRKGSALGRGLHNDSLRQIPDIRDYINKVFDLEHNSSNRPETSQRLLEYHAYD